MPAPLPRVPGERMQVGYEQSHRTSFLTGHIIWQDRLEVERKARTKQMHSWRKQFGTAAPDRPEQPAGCFSAHVSRWLDAPGPGGPSATSPAAARSRALQASASAPSLSTVQPARPMELPLRNHEVTARTWRMVGRYGVQGAAPKLPRKSTDKRPDDAQVYGRTAAVAAELPPRLSNGQMAPFAK
uniref:Uncharacterized protein n=1 Tax=Alexandrium catenella TaxID=2925 RepID=A0A7S1PMB2_ALECA|mmetsp:Transcript_105285/g.280330  ORF Transcript_105285/g.280330 Transcript_105285/m.280330 type:complete len:185 (+) Transcript_105285:98-652(+)